MAEAQWDVRCKAISSTGESCENSDNLQSDPHTTSEDLNSNPPLVSQVVRSSSNIFTRIKTLTLGRLRKQCHPATPKPIFAASTEPIVALDDVTPSADSTVISQRYEEKSFSSSKSGRSRRILSHLCTSVSTESEGESSVGSEVSNVPLETSERSPSSSSTSHVSRPPYSSSRLITSRSNQSCEVRVASQVTRPIQSSPSIAANSTNGHHNNVSQGVSSALVIRSPERPVSPRRPLESLPYPYLNRLNESSSTPAKAMSPPPAPVASKPVNRALPYRVHTQIDYQHCLVPEFREITNFPFYWGKMDQYQADKLLENKPHGTFLLRDSAQEGHLFSVSFCRYETSGHARIEQLNDKVTFNARDPQVFSSPTVRGLIEHYRDQKNLMLFEPVLSLPLHRPFAFSLKHLSRATICSLITYDAVSQLPLPKPLKHYLQEYHYKKKVAERRFDPNVS